MKAKRIAVLGSTGSIGTQAADVILRNRENYRVTALSCAHNIAQLSEQIELFAPELVSVEREEDARLLREKYKGLEVLTGYDGLNTIAESDCDILLNSLIGMIGLEPTYRALKKGTDIAFANKETLVAGGEIIMEAARKNGAVLLPVDSEHSAIFQCLQGNADNPIKRILLTASGGPFRGRKRDFLEQVTPEQALKHPNWTMGRKITVDSATMMNKGLEVIEAKHLFAVSAHDIEVVVHPQSVIHSMVEYRDGSIIAQLGLPNMRVPIAYAFSYPQRLDAPAGQRLDFKTLRELTFEAPDTETFRCLHMAYDAVAAGRGYPVVLNAANEVLVEAFLEKRIRFTDIQDNIERILERYKGGTVETVGDVIALDKETRESTRNLI